MIADYFNYAVPMEERWTAVSLFAGVGGFDLALERNGVDVVASAEIDKHARAILAKQFPNQKQFDDVRKVNANELRDAGFIPERGIITGGFPCQDLSVAGKRAGLVGARSGLFYEIARIADETKAKWLILENVPGLLTSQRGADMGAVVGTLVELGYGVAWRVLDAQHFGVPQRRRRVFIVAERAGGPTGPAEVLFKPTSLRGDSASSGTPRQEVAGSVGQGTESTSVYPINTLTLGGRPDPVNDRRMTMGMGNDGDPQFTISANHPHAVAKVEPISLYEPHHGDGPETIDRANTLNARMGTGGNNLPVLVEPTLANGKDITGTIPASLYHHGTVVNQDADSGMMVIEPDVPALVTMREGVTESGGRGPLVKYDMSLTLATGNGQTLFHNQSVRRLTPMECERLQGFPDGWTEGQADSHRYKQMGNAVAVPVVEWVIQGIMEVGQ